jgi:hypothetical protein
VSPINLLATIILGGLIGALVIGPGFWLAGKVLGFTWDFLTGMVDGLLALVSLDTISRKRRRMDRRHADGHHQGRVIKNCPQCEAAKRGDTTSQDVLKW